MKVFLAGTSHALALNAVSRTVERLAALGHQGILVVDGRHVDQADLLVAFVDSLTEQTTGAIQDAIEEDTPVLCAALRGTNVTADHLVHAQRAGQLQFTYFNDAEDLFDKIITFLGVAPEAAQPLHA